MKIETKYNINDKAWIMHKNKTQCVTICSVILEIKENEPILEKYSFKEIKLDSNKNFHPYFEKLFKTKEELIANL